MRTKLRKWAEKIFLWGLLALVATVLVLVVSGDELASLKDLPNGFGRVEITKSPLEATVTLYDSVGDQIYVNREDPAVIDVGLGAYKVEVTADRYSGQIYQVNVTPGKVTRISAKLEPEEELKQEQKSQGGLGIIVAIIVIPLVFFFAYFAAVRMIEDRGIG